MASLPSVKRLLIDKTNKSMVIIVSIASFVTVFSLVASKALLSQQAYQKRVTQEKERARDQLTANLNALTDLKDQYKAFVERPENALGGNPKGQGDKDGDNAKLVLDALPSKYDFPALATSLEKILTSQNFKIQSIGGVDDEVQQTAIPDSNNPVPVPMPFELNFSGTYASISFLLGTFEKSIRPIQIQSIELTGKDTEMNVQLNAQTYYQPGKSLSITTKVIK